MKLFPSSFSASRAGLRTASGLAASLLVALSGGVPVASAQTEVRVATWNLETIGQPGSNEYKAAVQVLRRIDADIVGINEINGSGDHPYLDDLAADAGYDHVFHAVNTVFGSDLNAFVSRFPILSAVEHDSVTLSGDPNANDMTRSPVEVTVDLDGNGKDLTLIVQHWKSGTTDDAVEFRRAVESYRIAQALDGLDPVTGAYIVMGDINDNLTSQPGNPPTFTTLPSGLPASFDLGTDLEAVLAGPGLANDPFSYLEDVSGPEMTTLAAVRTDATVTDPDGTGPQSADDEGDRRRLDFVLVSDAINNQGVQTEVYSSHDEVLGLGLPKLGRPLKAKVTDKASDHLPVFADLTIPTDCGNNNVDPGETCDDGNLVDGDGCDSNCTVSACGNGIVTGSELCDDGNLLDGDCCSSTCGRPGSCAPLPAKGSFVFRDDPSDPKKVQMQWNWRDGTAAVADFGDPTATTEFNVCVWDDDNLVLTAEVPAAGTCDGKPCWKIDGKPTAVRGYKYRNKGGTPDGIQQLAMRQGTGKARIQLKARGFHLKAPGAFSQTQYFEQTQAVRVQMVRADNAACWQSDFTVAKKNSALRYQAQAQ